LPGSRLAEKRVLVTRARRQASGLVAMLAERGARPVELPTIQYVEPLDPAPIDAAIAAMASFDWVIFTSANAVQALVCRLLYRGTSPECLRGVHLGAVGPATASALTDLGLTVDVCPPTYVAEALVAEFRKLDLRGSSVLLPQAQDARDVLRRGLEDQGAIVHAVTAYRVAKTQNGELARRLFANRAVDIVTLTSSSTARNLVELLGCDAMRVLATTTIASIGPITSQTARELGLTVAVEAREHTIQGLVTALESFLGGEADGGCPGPG